MAAVRERWLSGRAVSLHCAGLAFVPGRAAAAFAVDEPDNARLAEVAAEGPKTWRARQNVVVRRER